jgi:hypothetical protein
VILLGSGAHETGADRLSDIDLMVITTQRGRLSSLNWLESMRSTRFLQPESVCFALVSILVVMPTSNDSGVVSDLVFIVGRGPPIRQGRQPLILCGGATTATLSTTGAFCRG